MKSQNIRNILIKQYTLSAMKCKLVFYQQSIFSIIAVCVTVIKTIYLQKFNNTPRYLAMHL